MPQRVIPFSRSSNGQAQQEVAPEIARIGLGFVNAYMVGREGEEWVLVDAGLPGSGPIIRRAAAHRYGSETRPEAIILTHGHGDHTGAAKALAKEWEVPIYAHPAEMPFLTGRSEYPPPDPTVGGPMGLFSRFASSGAVDLSEYVQELPPEGELPGMMADWRWIHTPGHTPGHISLYRDTDRVLIAGDALATVDGSSWTAQLTQRRQVSRPLAPFTSDWEAARRSVERLAELEPGTIAAGHGAPMTGSNVSQALRHLAEHFSPPERGRYVGHPARTTEEEGVVELPPRVPDPVPFITGVAAGTLGGIALLVFLRRNKS